MDLLNLMTYDAGSPATTGFDPKEAFDAYRSLYTGDIVVGVSPSLAGLRWIALLPCSISL